MAGKKYENLNTQVECEDTLHPYSHMFIFQELIDEIPDAEAVIMMQLSLLAGMKCWKENGKVLDKSEMNQLHFSDTFKPKHYIDINEDYNKSILEYHMFFK